MTANKIADELEEWVSPRTVEHAVAMLRKQQDEIEALKQKLENLPMSLKDDIEYWSKK
jgi:hypothetical protein